MRQAGSLSHLHCGRFRTEPHRPDRRSPGSVGEHDGRFGPSQRGSNQRRVALLRGRRHFPPIASGGRGGVDGCRRRGPRRKVARRRPAGQKQDRGAGTCRFPIADKPNAIALFHGSGNCLVPDAPSSVVLVHEQERLFARRKMHRNRRRAEWAEVAALGNGRANSRNIAGLISHQCRMPALPRRRAASMNRRTCSTRSDSRNLGSVLMPNSSIRTGRSRSGNARRRLSTRNSTCRSISGPLIHRS